MSPDFLTLAAPVIGAAFFASLVEAVEAFTIVLAIGTTRGWRPALAGAVAGLATLAAIVLALGPLLDRIPIHALQLVVGLLLLLFGLGWLRKAILRSAGVVALHDEAVAYDVQVAESRDTRDWIAGIAVYKAMLLEGLEVVFVVIAVGAGQGMLWEASLGAVAACALVLALGFLVHKPLSRVPENALKFGVGVMLAAFGTFWVGEGLGIDWPGADLILLPLATLFLAGGLALIGPARRAAGEGVA
ncbi:COG4280 domain-containing protein [uncultured Jannaschia sp.]|uniref:COG4280 domain-containing protein n=1 Tax=uncultured Jannaschia sp. TaxID=293347 RepID=UPI00262E0CFC|nr:TMEM165/GDT1 family protein [uncultured Jannaschia sp.]